MSENLGQLGRSLRLFLTEAYYWPCAYVSQAMGPPTIRQYLLILVFLAENGPTPPAFSLGV